MLGFLKSSYSYSDVKQALEENTFTLDMLDSISPEQLLAVEATEPYKGRTILWLLASHPDATFFLHAFTRHEASIGLKDILVAPEDSKSTNGMSLLSLVVNAIILDKKMTKPFMAVWHKFKGELTLDLLRKTVVAKDSNGSLWMNSVLWMIAFASFIAKIDVFEELAEKFQHQFVITDLLEARRRSNFSKPNLLWFLAELASKSIPQGKPQIFNSVWKKCRTHLSAEDFRSKVQDEKVQGPSALWLLAKSAISYGSLPFLAVWEAFRSKWTYEDLSSAVTTTSGQVITVFSSIASIKEGGQGTLFEIVSQIPGMPSAKIMQFVQAGISQEFYKSAQAIFDQKQKLEDCIKNLNRKKLLNIPFEMVDLEKLFEVGEETVKAGYINAFYEISKLLENTNSIGFLEKARKKLSINSWFDEVPPETRAQAFYDYARGAHGHPQERDKYLLASLNFAIRITEPSRSAFIQKIACYYITGSTPMPSQVVSILTADDLKIYYSSLDFQRLNDRLDKLKAQHLAQHSEEDEEVEYLTTDVQNSLTFSVAPRPIIRAPSSLANSFVAPTPPPSPRVKLG